jgi:acetolactate synthase-1/2/3 large subunit
VRLVELLESSGVDTVFGIPGVHTIELYRGLGASSVRHIRPNHEQGAGFMADGYASVTGRPGVCFVIAGPGLTNAVTPVAQAFRESRPMLMISTHTEATGEPGGPALHALPDQQGLMASVCGRSVVVKDPDELPELIAEAFVPSSVRRPRPTHVSLSPEMLARDCGPLEARGQREEPLQPSSVEIRAAADVVRAAAAPILILGGGAVNAGHEATLLAELIGAPIVLSTNAKGCVPADHPLCLGTTMGLLPVLDLIAAADVVIAVGTELSPVEALPLPEGIPVNGRLVRVDVDKAQLAARPCDAPVLGDARTSLHALYDDLVSSRGSNQAETPQLNGIRSEIRRSVFESGLTPWLDAIAAAVDKPCSIALDSTHLGYAAHRGLDLHWIHRWLAPFGYGTLGCALPMAIGARAGMPDRLSVAIAGDGGVLLTVTELATAARERLPVILLVWNNREYREIRRSMEHAGVVPLGCENGGVNFVALARSLGCRGEQAETPDQLQRILSSLTVDDGRPTVVEIVPEEPMGEE